MVTPRRMWCSVTKKVAAKKDCELFLFPLVPLCYNVHYFKLEFQSIKS